MKGILLYAQDGGHKSVNPVQGDTFSLQELQKMVNGYIELVFLGKNSKGRELVLVVNEEGKLNGLALNSLATMIYQERTKNRQDVVVGNALLTFTDCIN